MLVYLKIGVKVSKPISWIGFPSSYAPRDDHLPCLTLRESSRAAVYLHENFCESLGVFLTDRRTAPKAWDSWSKWVLLRFQAINLYAKSSLLLSSSHSVGKSIKICLILHFGDLNILRLSTLNLLQDIFPKKCKILIRFLEAFLSTVRGKQTMTDDMNREQNWTPLLNVIIQITIFKGAKKLEIISNVSVSK